MQSISKAICFSYRHYAHRSITKNELRQGMTKQQKNKDQDSKREIMR